MNTTLYSNGADQYYLISDWEYQIIPIYGKMVEQAYLFDKKEVHLCVVTAVRHAFAGRLSGMFCLS